MPLRLYEGLMYSLESATADSHHDDVRQQLEKSYKATKLIGALRILPRPITQSLVGALRSSDKLPFTGTLGSPLSYGVESVVSRIDGTGRVLKVIKPRVDEKDELTARRQSYETYKKYFGEQALTTHFVLAQGRYKFVEASLYAVQQEIDGNDIFSALDEVKADEIERLVSSSEQMIEETGEYPDFIGTGNVLVDSSGKVHIVDVFQTFSEDDMIRQVLPKLAVIGSRLASHSGERVE